jgi:hypothetical protein
MFRRVLRPAGSLVVIEMHSGDWEAKNGLAAASADELLADLGDGFRMDQVKTGLIMDVELKGEKMRQAYWIAHYTRS